MLLAFLLQQSSSYAIDRLLNHQPFAHEEADIASMALPRISSLHSPSSLFQPEVTGPSNVLNLFDTPVYDLSLT